MPIHTETQILPYPPAALQALVADVGRYPEFLPWCRAARVLERGEGEFMAELVICYLHMCESYTSRVVVNEGAIDVTMVKGPFEHLINRWRFVPVGEASTRVEFFLDFKFRSKILERLMGAFFTKATAKMVDAFKARAQALYGDG